MVAWKGGGVEGMRRLLCWLGLMGTGILDSEASCSRVTQDSCVPGLTVFVKWWLKIFGTNPLVG